MQTLINLNTWMLALIYFLCCSDMWIYCALRDSTEKDKLSKKLLSTRRPKVVSSGPELSNGSSVVIYHNVTRVLDNLLRNYDRNQRPDKEGLPTVISTNIYIKSIGPVSELEMNYQMDCYFRQSWLDERLKFDSPVENLSLNMKMLEGIWKPDTYFHNGQHAYVHALTRPNKLIRIRKNGQVLYSTRLTIKAKCPMQLHSFPMDRQSCPLVFGSYAYTMDEVKYTWDFENAISLAGMAISQFDLVGSPQRNMTVKMRRGVFSTLQVNFNLKRHAGYFLIQVYVPCAMIVMLSWVSFWINREATSDRIGLGITTVLTLSTLGVDTRSDLPKVHYATALDWFVIICFSFVIASLLEFAGVHYFTKIDSGEAIGDEDDVTEEAESDWEDPESNEEGVNDIAVKAHFDDMNLKMSDQDCYLNYERRVELKHRQRNSTHTKLNRDCCVQFLYCLLGDDAYRSHQSRCSDGVNSVSRIDKTSRILFPLSFAILNFFYWMIYTVENLPEDWTV